ncbi:MAG: SDR family NAD(P)-dependent oxidoreductase [Euryarchaeota archaeon]
MTTVLVTGGAGFIGSHVVEELVARDYHVGVVDALTTGDLSNLERVLDDVEFWRTDVRDPHGLETVLRELQPDVIVHLAAQTNVRYSMDNPLADATVNALGTLNLAALAARHEVDRLVYASSGGAVYGEPRYLPVDEEHPTHPISNYGASKLAGEHYVHVYAEAYDLDHVILRYANVYGPRQDPRGEAGVIPIFLLRAAKNEPLRVFGDGEQTRDFIFVRDVARVTADAVERGHGTYNIGSGRETSINELIDLIREVTNRDVKVVYERARPGEVRRIYLDVTRARKELDFEPETDLREGIKLTWNWIREHVL